jgi:hypothetical protein
LPFNGEKGIEVLSIDAVCLEWVASLGNFHPNDLRVSDTMVVEKVRRVGTSARLPRENELDHAHGF